MKTTSLKKQCAILAVSAGIAFHGAIGAETVVTQTKQTTTNGTISSFEPERFIIKSETGPDAVTYSYGKTTQYVDEEGRVIARETIKPGAPVTVHYVRDGDRMVADRVVVRKTVTTTTEDGRPPTRREREALRDAAEHPEREARRAAERGKPFPPVDPSIPKTTATVTTTSSDGTISSFNADQFAITSAKGERPVTYRYSKTTQYVDEDGTPVSVEVVKSGVPVTVSYIREGDGFIAQRVIVHRRR